MVAITIRDVPEEARDSLAARASRSGTSLQEYLRGLLIAAAARPTVDEVIERARLRVAATGIRIDADAIHRARGADRR